MKDLIKEFKKGHKGEELMEVAEAEAEIQIALENQKKDILEKVEKMKETPANRGMFMWVQGYNQAIKALKKHLT